MVSNIFSAICPQMSSSFVINEPIGMCHNQGLNVHDIRMLWKSAIKDI
jgi:hypothetical protein